MQAKILNVANPVPRDIWEGLYRSDPEAIPDQSPAWLDCACATGGYEDASRYYELSNGHKFVIPIVRRRKLGITITAGSMPHGWGMGGLIGNAPPTPEELHEILADLSRLPFLSLDIRPNPRFGSLWKDAIPSNVLRIPRLAHIVNLEGGYDEVCGKRFNSKVRTAVRKARKSGVEVECDTTGSLVPVFYDLWQRSLERWAQQQHEPLWLAKIRGQHRDPISKFQHMAEHLGEACQIWVARLDGQPIAAIIVVQGTNAHCTRGAMDKDLASPVRANDLLHKLAIEDACCAGCRFYHMGESGSSVALAQFKESFGAEAYPYEEYYLEKFPITRTDRLLRSAVKKAIGFQD